MIKIDRTGCTRIVVLTKRYAFKFPNFLDGWPRLFYTGLLANLQEKCFAGVGWPELCPVKWSLPWGFLVVMPRCQVLSDDEFLSIDYAEWIKRGEDLPKGEWVIPVEPKSNSFGWYEGRVVAIDYGN